MKTKEIRGITLIALVVTIAVLLIIAGVSINAVIGDDGLVKKAQESAASAAESEAKEIMNRAVLEFQLSKGDETLEEFLKGKVAKGKIDNVEKNEDGTLTITKDGYTLKVENKSNTSKKDENDKNDNNNNQEDKKDEGKLTLSSYSGEYTYPNSGTFTVIENSGTISATSSNTDVATVVVNGNLVTVIPGTTEGTTNIKVISAETEKYNAKIVTYVAIVKKGTFSKESGIGYYADIDDDGTVDGIIFEDFRNGGSGTWGGSNYSFSIVTDIKNYYISKKDYSGPFGVKDVLAPTGTGNTRFYVMALRDASTSSSVASGAKKLETEIWKIPTNNEWLAFGDQLGITKLNYTVYGLSNRYWTSTEGINYSGNTISFSDGTIKGVSNTGVYKEYYYTRLVTKF